MKETRIVERSIDIVAPIDRVFLFVANVRNTPRWLSAIKSVWDISCDTPGLGVTYRWKYKIFVLTFVGTGECVVHESPRCVIFRTRGDSVGDWTFTLEERGHGTHLTLTSTYTSPDSFLGPLRDSAIKFAVNRIINYSVEIIKDLCEAEVVSKGRT
ncbi:MAG: SRPBCC family protein [bacterium]|nr:SRPBCC family protein [bacterium]